VWTPYLNVGGHIVRGLPLPRVVRDGRRRHGCCLRLLAHEGSSGGDSTFKVELGQIVDFLDANEVAQLLFLLTLTGRVASPVNNTSETPLIVVWPFITNLLAGVEEVGHGGADGSDAAGEGSSWHGGILTSPNCWHSSYGFLP
jgi:hypothetical protein